MARKPRSTRPPEEDEELGGGIVDENDDDGDDELIKIIEPEPNQNKSGIVVEDYEAGQETSAPAEPSTPVMKGDDKPFMSDSARATLEAEQKLGRENQKKHEAEMKANAKAQAKAEPESDEAE
jgi:hypothetical protein